MYVDITQCLPNDDYTICIYFHYQRGLEVIVWVCLSYLNKLNYIRSLGQGSCQCWFYLIFFSLKEKNKKNSGKVSICTYLLNTRGMLTCSWNWFSILKQKNVEIAPHLLSWGFTDRCWQMAHVDIALPFTEMFLFALPVFKIESVLLRQQMMLFSVFHIQIH